MQPFDYITPDNYEEASALLLAGTGSVRAFQGGTDLIIRIRGGFIKPEKLIDLKFLPGMRDIAVDDSGWLVIGAACSMNQIARHPAVAEQYNLLAQACNSVASYQLRNRATIGGNCCNASPAADTAPALYCLEAMAQIYGPEGTRRLPIADFFTGPGRNALREGEFLTGVVLPPAMPGGTGAFNKLGRTRIGDISTVSVAVWAAPNPGPRTPDVIRWRISLGAVGPTPLRAPKAEAILMKDHSASGIAQAADLATSAARPIDDIRASAAYRRAMVRVLTRRGIETVLANLPKADESVWSRKRPLRAGDRS